MSTIISFAQLGTAVLLIVLVLLQERTSGLSGVFGGGDGGGFYQTRRGLEKIIFKGTIVTAVLFLLFSVMNLVI
jgi:protein translocase SecG subunit